MLDLLEIAVEFPQITPYQFEIEKGDVKQCNPTYLLKDGMGTAGTACSIKFKKYKLMRAQATTWLLELL